MTDQLQYKYGPGYLKILKMSVINLLEWLNIVRMIDWFTQN